MIHHCDIIPSCPGSHHGLLFKPHIKLFNQLSGFKQQIAQHIFPFKKLHFKVRQIFRLFLTRQTLGELIMFLNLLHRFMFQFFFCTQVLISLFFLGILELSKGRLHTLPVDHLGHVLFNELLDQLLLVIQDDFIAYQI